MKTHYNWYVCLKQSIFIQWKTENRSNSSVLIICTLFSSKANRNFSDALEKNKELRQDIESLRRGRIRFEGIYKKLEKELQQLRQEIGEVIDQSTQAYDAKVCLTKRQCSLLY